jgi:hypothetical protein
MGSFSSGSPGVFPMSRPWGRQGFVDFTPHLHGKFGFFRLPFMLYYVLPYVNIYLDIAM